jgi:hypothetical protein
MRALASLIAWRLAAACLNKGLKPAKILPIHMNSTTNMTPPPLGPVNGEENLIRMLKVGRTEYFSVRDFMANVCTSQASRDEFLELLASREDSPELSV